jgi:hypothetical protein
VAPNQQENTHFSTEKEMKTMGYIQFFFVHNRIISAVKWAESVSERMS